MTRRQPRTPTSNWWHRRSEDPDRTDDDLGADTTHSLRTRACCADTPPAERRLLLDVAEAIERIRAERGG